MKINKIEIRNFYSIKKISLNFDKFKGTVLVEGKNKDTGGSNGSGKSALLEAVVWGIFGKTIRKSTEEALVNIYAKKECSVKIYLNGNVIIERGKRPTYLRFFVGEKELTQDNALNTQKLIEEHLKSNYKVFLASTIFGQHNTMEFLNATPDDKRSIIKNFLHLDSLFSLRDSVKFLKSQYSQTIKKHSAILDEHEKSLLSFDKKIKHLNKLQKDVEGKYDEETLALSLQEVIQREKENTDTEWEIKDIKRLVVAEEEKIKALVNRLENPTTATPCTKCGQNITTPYHPKRLQLQIEERKSFLSSYQADCATHEDKIYKLPISSSEFHKVIEYNQLKKESETFTELRQETKQKIQESYDVKQENNSNYEIMRFWEKAFSEAGLVKYIIRNILDYFNGKTNFYLSHLSKGKFFIEFDEQLNEKILHNGQSISYISLSGGEKKKISLAVMLGLQELLTISNQQNTNLMFFDEVAENLDQDGLDGLYILLSEMKKDHTLFVITHNNYLKSLLEDGRTLTITKKNGISTLNRR